MQRNLIYQRRCPLSDNELTWQSEGGQNLPAPWVDIWEEFLDARVSGGLFFELVFIEFVDTYALRFQYNGRMRAVLPLEVVRGKDQLPQLKGWDVTAEAWKTDQANGFLFGAVRRFRMNSIVCLPDTPKTYKEREEVDDSDG